MHDNPPVYVQPPEDPAYLALQKKAQDDQAAAASDTVRMDSASLLARYGTLVSLANAGSPTAPGSPQAAPNQPINQSGAMQLSLVTGGKLSIPGAS